MKAKIILGDGERVTVGNTMNGSETQIKYDSKTDTFETIPESSQNFTE